MITTTVLLVWRISLKDAPGVKPLEEEPVPALLETAWWRTTAINIVESRELLATHASGSMAARGAKLLPPV